MNDITAIPLEETALRLLSQNVLFWDFPQEELSGLLSLLPLRMHMAAAGEAVVRIDDPAEHIYAVLSGLLAEQRSEEGAHVHRFRYHGPGDLFGLEAYFSKIRRSHVEVIAIEESVLISFPLEPLLEHERYGKRTEQVVRQLLANNAVRNTLKMDVLLATSLREKIFTFFRTMRDKYRSSFFQIRMSQTELAEYLGVNRSALSRELNQMQREGLIKILPNRSYHVMKWESTPPGGGGNRSAQRGKSTSTA